MRAWRRIVTATTLALTMAVLAPGVAHADGAPVPLPTDDLPRSRCFAWALDLNEYFRMPGGDFEDGGDGWTTTGGARVVSGVNETVLPASPTDSHALNLPSGSTAVAAPIAVDGSATFMRFFARSRGLAGIAVVTVTARSASGATQTLLSPALPLTSAWSSPLLLFRLPLLGDDFTSVTVTIRSIGLGSIDVDDVFVDPIRQRS